VSENTDTLFNPFSYKGLSLVNGVVIAPMTRALLPGGAPTTAVADYFRRRAQGGRGLIITEGTIINDMLERMEKGEFGLVAVGPCYKIPAGLIKLAMVSLTNSINLQKSRCRKPSSL
jgi:hypothetical protein